MLLRPVEDPGSPPDGLLRSIWLIKGNIFDEDDVACPDNCGADRESAEFCQCGNDVEDDEATRWVWRGLNGAR